ncbi:MAG: hypothetical protein AABX33_00210 [Nanoarchaeota archaeon]
MNVVVVMQFLYVNYVAMVVGYITIFFTLLAILFFTYLYIREKSENRKWKKEREKRKKEEEERQKVQQKEASTESAQTETQKDIHQ